MASFFSQMHFINIVFLWMNDLIHRNNIKAQTCALAVGLFYKGEWPHLKAKALIRTSDEKHMEI